MRKTPIWPILKLGAWGLGVLALGGCPDSSQTLLSQASDANVIPVVQSKSTAIALAEMPPQSVEFEVCSHLPEWQRPDLEGQLAELANNPRYGEALNEEPLKELFDKFWQESVITFTTYGLSARTEPIYLSGVWTAIAEMDACYQGDRPEAINQGQLAEMWLIGHQVTDMVWTGTEYQVMVESSSQGLQFVQFERFESADTLPVVVIEANGEEITVASGDW
jgi:hypothetical protein